MGRGQIKINLSTKYFRKLNKNHLFKSLLVVGGNFWDGVSNNDRALDSTEIYSGNSWRILSSKLPEAMLGMQVGNINNKVLLFGKLIS